MNPSTPTAPMSDEALHKAAKKRVDLKMGFYTHLLVFVLVNSGLFLLNGMVGGGRWHFFPLYGWGLGLAIHGIVTFFALNGMGLRDKMMAQEIEALRRRQ